MLLFDLSAYPAYNGKLSLTDVVTTVVMKKYALTLSSTEVGRFMLPL
jgi:hypothetical protein